MNGTLEWADKRSVVNADSEPIAGESTNPSAPSNIAKNAENNQTEEKLYLCFKASSWIRGKYTHIPFCCMSRN